MDPLTTTSLLASFATIKSLSDERKYRGPYEVLREFIRHIFCVDAIRLTTAYDIRNRLKKHFGFELPEAVIRSSLNNMSGVSLNKGEYTVSSEIIKCDEAFERKRESAYRECNAVITELTNYLKSTLKDNSINEVLVTRELFDFLVEEQTLNNQYKDYICSFIALRESDKQFQEALNSILEGGLLYLGLSQNVNETGSLKKPIRLYLGTEILFDIMGLNGEIHKALAYDFLELVKAANEKGTKISLMYFEEVKKDIRDFYYAAESIVEEKKTMPIGKPAMSSIINGCKTGADVEVKLSDFFHECEHKYGIRADTCESYYKRENYELNLEDERELSEENDEDKRRKKSLALKQISNVNKLRKGKKYTYELESEHLVVTNASATLEMSQKLTRDLADNPELVCCGYAASLNKITNILWYKLGGFFTKRGLPSNVNAIINAKVALSTSIGYQITRVYKDAVKEFRAGSISEDQFAARIIALKEKSKLPEEFNEEEVMDALDFSQENLRRYEGALADNKAIQEEKKRVVEELTNTKAEKQAYKEDLDRLKGSLESTNAENIKMKKELDEIHRKKERMKRIGKFVLFTILGIIILGALLFIVGFLERHEFIKSLVSLGADLIAFGGFLIWMVSLVKKTFFSSSDKSK